MGFVRFFLFAHTKKVVHTWANVFHVVRIPKNIIVKMPWPSGAFFTTDGASVVWSNVKQVQDLTEASQDLTYASSRIDWSKSRLDLSKFKTWPKHVKTWLMQVQDLT